MTRRSRIFVWLSVPLAIVMFCWLLLDTRWGLQFGLRIVSGLLPGTLNVATQDGTLLGPVVLRGLQYRDGELHLSIRQMDLDWRVMALLSGKLQIDKLHLDGIKLGLPAGKKTTKTKTPAAVSLPVAVNLHDVSIQELVVQSAPGAAPLRIDALHLNAAIERDRLTIRQFTVKAFHTDLSANGSVKLDKSYSVKLALTSRYQIDPGHKLIGQGSLRGNLKKLSLQQTLSGLLAGRLNAQAENILGNPRWQASLAVQQLALQAVAKNSPNLSLQGDIHAKGDLKRMQAESRLQLAGNEIGEARLRMDLSSDLAMTAYQLQANGTFHSQQWPDANLALQANGDRQQVKLSSLAIESLQGSIKGEARLNWHKPYQLNASLNLQNLNPGSVWRDWPGKLNAKLNLQTSISGNKSAPQLHFMLQDIKGSVRTYPVNGNIAGNWSSQALVLRSAQLQLAGSHIRASGTLAETWNLRFQAQSDKLEALLPTLRGELNLDGQLSGQRTLPRLRLEASARNLAYKQDSAGNLKLSLDLGLARHARSVIDLQAEDVKARNSHWQTLTLQTRGTNARQHITLLAHSDIASLNTQLTGSFSPWRWQGTLEKFVLQEADYGDWQLQQAANIQLARNDYAVSSLCLAQAGAHLCMNGKWSALHHQAGLDIQAMPLHLLQPWLPKDVQLNGKLDARAELHTTAKGAVRGTLSARAHDKNILVRFADSKEPLSMVDARLNARLDDKGLQASLVLPLHSGGGLKGSLTLPGWSPLQGLPHTQSIAANLDLEQLPAGMLTHFVPQTVKAKGNIQAKLQVQGSLGTPQLSGSVNWKGGMVTLPDLGIELWDISAKISSEKFNTLAFTLLAHSGDGDLKLEGQTQLNPARGWPTQASLISHNLEVSNIAEALVVVDSQIKISLQGNQINLAGDITIPRARLRPKQLPEGGAPVSPDIVIVEGKQTLTASRWILTAHLRVQLGEQVNFDGFDIKGKLHGNLMINAEPGKLILGQGEVNITDGTYRLRGQDLTIRRGRLIFSNTFIDDPALDVEAVRVISNVTAGVRLKGTLKQPQLSIFSEPAMSSSDALAYLLFGHPFSQSTLSEGQSVSNATSALGLVAGNYLAKDIGGALGLDELRLDVNQTTQNTSLVLGKYLSPKLYLRYYSGIAEASRILQLQYQLSKRFQLQTESGYRGSQSITGGDIFFTVEY